MDNTGQVFLASLHRGGEYAYYWLPDKEQGRGRTFAYRIGERTPHLPENTDVYFGVNPSVQLLGYRQRGGNNGVACMACLFADFDAKDFVPLDDVDLEPYMAQIRANGSRLSEASLLYQAERLYQKTTCQADPKGWLRVAADHIHALTTSPSYVVYTGGGYHVYWLLKEPFLFANDEERQAGRILLHDWIEFVGGDTAAADLNRVLRLPGTYNYKYDPPRKAGFAVFDPERMYTMALLAALAAPISWEPVVEKPVKPAVKPQTTYYESNHEFALAVIAAFKARYTVEDILSRNGYARLHAGSNRWKRPDGSSGSVVVKGDRSYHHSGNDLLYHENYGGTGAHDSFSLFAELECGGKKRAALFAAAQELGMQRKIVHTDEARQAFINTMMAHM